MPTRRRYDEEDDSRPAFGLREDAFDDALRRTGRLSDEDREWFQMERLPGQLRRIEHYPKNPDEWLRQTYMTQTETALRLARALIVSGVAQSRVTVTLAGNELTHQGMPRFPVKAFLLERLGFIEKRARVNSWKGVYALPGHDNSIVLLDRDRQDGHLTTRLPGWRRLVAFVTRGNVRETRSSAEDKWVQNVIGRAAIWDARPGDVLAVCFPRSAHFLKIMRKIENREGIRRLRLHPLMVERLSGDVRGLETLKG